MNRIFVCVAVALAVSAPASAVAPTLIGVSATTRRPAAAFAAPGADTVFVTMASKPDQATNGEFFRENVKLTASLTTDEIQSGRWVSDRRVDPGRYWVNIQAFRSFALCYVFELGDYRPECADGYSNVLPLAVPRPVTTYTTTARLFRFLGEVDITLRGRPLGERTGYRVCYLNRRGTKRCLNGVIDGYSWEQTAEDMLEVRTRGLARVTTFTWTVRGKVVARRRVVTQ